MARNRNQKVFWVAAAAAEQIAITNQVLNLFSVEHFRLFLYKMEENQEDPVSNKKRKPSQQDERKVANREKMRIIEQNRRNRVKEYFATLKNLVPINANNPDPTQEDILAQAIHLLESRKRVVPPQLPLSQIELSELFVSVHRDAFFKITSINSNSTFAETNTTLNYLSDLSSRSQDPRLRLHAAMSQIALNCFVYFKPHLCMQIFETLIPLYDSIAGQNQVYQLGYNLGNSEWILPTYALVLASCGQFDKSAMYEKRALQLANARPEVGGHIYACLYFIRYFRGEKLSIQEAVETYNRMKEISYLKDYASLAFGFGLLQNSKSIAETMEAKTIIENSQDAIYACPYFEFHLRAMFIECMQQLNPERALVDVDTALVLREIKGKSGCFTKADFLRMKADTLIKVRTQEFGFVKAEELYKEAIDLSVEEGLSSCTLKATVALCRLYKLQQKRTEYVALGKYLLNLVADVKKNNENEPHLLKSANEVLLDLLELRLQKI